MDARRLELYELLKPKLDEEPARQLVLALSPEPHRLVTVDDLDRKFDAFEARLDVKFARLDVKFAQIDARFDRSESVLTRRMITIMGAWTILVGSTIGWVAALLH
jgi:hypothetical protein